MIVGIIGSGGREHAICHALNKSKKIDKIYCFPGNAGTDAIAENVNLDINKFEEMKNFILSPKTRTTTRSTKAVFPEKCSNRTFEINQTFDLKTKFHDAQCEFFSS